MKVRVDFLARDEQAVLPEMGVRVRFLSDDAPAGVETGAVADKVVVPQAAVQSDADGSFVWIVSDEVAHKHAVDVGVDSGERIEVTSGVNAGDQVVVRGVKRLTGETAAVRVVE